MVWQTVPDIDITTDKRVQATIYITMLLEYHVPSVSAVKPQLTNLVVLVFASVRSFDVEHRSLGPFHGAIAVPSVTRCRCRRRRRRGHRCADGVRRDSSDTW